tara:strand:+ start:2155 stop:2367 length:213 start_codon:yes stop_codon:yes gene_type:complete
MNQEQRAQRYDWLLEQYKKVENDIKRVPKLSLDQTLNDINSREYTNENLNKVNHLKEHLKRIDTEVKGLF